MKHMSNFDLIDFAHENHSDEEYMKALIDYCYQDLMIQKRYEKEYGQTFTEIKYKVDEQRHLQEVKFLKDNI